MKKMPPYKVYIKENGKYIAMSYPEFQKREREDETYKTKLFIPVQGCILEVSEKFRQEFYQIQENFEYQQWRTEFLEISFNMYDSDEDDGAEILTDKSADFIDDALDRVIVDQVKKFIDALPEAEKALVIAIFFEGRTEREFSKISGIPQKTINDRKHKIVEKIKKFLEI